MPINEAGPWWQPAAKGAFVCGLTTLESSAPNTPECEGHASADAVVAANPVVVEMNFITAGIDHACGLQGVNDEPLCWGSDDANQSTIPDWAGED